MPGYPSIESVTGGTSKRLVAEQLRLLLASAVVGIVAGLLMAHVRLHLGLAGHKALFWMIPIIAARLAIRCPAGATTGALAAAVASLGFGGYFAGGVAYLPLAGVAGILLDFTVGFAERHRLAALWTIPLVCGAGLLANLVCFVKHFVPPASLKPHLFLGLSGPWGSLVSYAVFGLLAGLIGATVGCAARRRDKSCT